jgi:hypothetical protein
MALAAKIRSILEAVFSGYAHVRAVVIIIVGANILVKYLLWWFWRG